MARRPAANKPTVPGFLYDHKGRCYRGVVVAPPGVDSVPYWDNQSEGGKALQRHGEAHADLHKPSGTVAVGTRLAVTYDRPCVATQEVGFLRPGQEPSDEDPVFLHNLVQMVAGNVAPDPNWVPRKS